MGLYRNYHSIEVLAWIDPEFNNHFVGTVKRKAGYRDAHDNTKIHYRDDTEACYGWSKGGSFFIYTIENGHIHKLGTVKRHVVLDDEEAGV
jgi:hypothetical protein